MYPCLSAMMDCAFNENWQAVWARRSPVRSIKHRCRRDSCLFLTHHVQGKIRPICTIVATSLHHDQVILHLPISHGQLAPAKHHYLQPTPQPASDDRVCASLGYVQDHTPRTTSAKITQLIYDSCGLSISPCLEFNSGSYIKENHYV